MSRKIKIDEKAAVTVARNEILQVADIVARDKGLEKEEVLEAMEDAILKTAQLKYGTDRELKVVIDRKTGEISAYAVKIIVENVQDPNTEIALDRAQQKMPEAKCGDEFLDELPKIEFGRVGAQSARQVIMQKVRTAERNKQFDAFSGRVGEIVTGAVKRTELFDTILDVGRTEGILRRNNIIPNETFKAGDRIRALLLAIDKDGTGPMLVLSRTHNDFMRRLFEQEVPEVYDGIVKIIAIARDPGSKAKIAVTTADSSLDPIGACVGVKGSRVQAVCSELKGEKIDIVLWSDNPAVFIVNALAPAEVLKIVIDENQKSVEAIVPDDQLSIAIGRRGQNVKLASKLTGWNISVVTEEEDSKKRAEENARVLQHLQNNLDVDDMVAHLLITEGYNSIDDIAEAEVSELAGVEGFDEDLAKELHDRALNSVQKKKKSIDNLCKRKGVKQDLREYAVLSPELLELLVENGVKCLQDLGDLSTDELLDIAGSILSKDDAEALIMDVRKDWF